LQLIRRATLFSSAIIICFPFGPEQQRITASISHKFSLANRQSTSINKGPGEVEMEVGRWKAIAQAKAANRK